ncbi:MAG TPA: ROK family protein, partial [Alphaproteobacteria bacterium]|nr:ROK family protein [Alphaproteobacteria bacterium]
VDPEGPPCGCGSRGCLEQFASATAVRRMAAEAAAAGKAPVLAQAMRGNPEFSSKNVYELAMQGDEASRRIFERVGNALGIALAGLINILNLPMYVVGGGVASAWDAFAPTMLERVRKNSFVYRATAPDTTSTARPAGKTIITRALLGSDAGLVGAARLPMLGE